jgi:hypothetical protein
MQLGSVIILIWAGRPATKISRCERPTTVCLKRKATAPACAIREHDGASAGSEIQAYADVSWTGDRRRKSMRFAAGGKQRKPGEEGRGRTGRLNREPTNRAARSAGGAKGGNGNMRAGKARAGRRTSRACYGAGSHAEDTNTLLRCSPFAEPWGEWLSSRSDRGPPRMVGSDREQKRFLFHVKERCA